MLRDARMRRALSQRGWLPKSSILNGHGIPDHDLLGVRVVDDSFLLLINAWHEPITFTLPDPDYAPSWRTVLDTADPQPPAPAQPDLAAGAEVEVAGRSLRVLRAPRRL
jgi:isoamylase